MKDTDWKLPGRMYRYFIFCDEIRDKRETQSLFTLFKYYNIAVSEYNCILEHDVGDECSSKDEFGVPFNGICTLLETKQLV